MVIVFYQLRAEDETNKGSFHLQTSVTRNRTRLTLTLRAPQLNVRFLLEALLVKQ